MRVLNFIVLCPFNPYGVCSQSAPLPSSPLPSYNAAIVVAVGLALAVEVDGGVCGHRLGPGEERPGPLASAGRGRHAAQNRAEAEEARVVEP